MLARICRTLWIVMSSFLVLTPMLAAQQADSSAAPVPPQIINAHRVFVSNGGGSNYFEIFSGGPNRAYSTFYKMLKKTGQYELVDSPGQADLVFEIRAIAPATASLSGTVSYNPQVVLTVRDPETNSVLWSERANVRAFGTKGRRDRQFDESVAVLVDKLAAVTGRPLTEAQTQAIAANSKMPTAEKVILVTGIAGLAAITAVGIHMATSHHQPAPPPVPSAPTPPFP